MADRGLSRADFGQVYAAAHCEAVRLVSSRCQEDFDFGALG
jgi:hypothetical protein